MSTLTSNSTITGEIHTKIDNWSAKSVHYNEKFHYYGVHYYERRLYFVISSSEGAPFQIRIQLVKYLRFLKSEGYLNKTKDIV